MIAGELLTVCNRWIGKNNLQFLLMSTISDLIQDAICHLHWEQVLVLVQLNDHSPKRGLLELSN